MSDFCAVGLDLSYTSTGMCAMRRDAVVTTALRFKGSAEHPGERLDWLFDNIERFIAKHKPTAVFAERPFTPPRGSKMDPSIGIKLGMLHGGPMASAFRHGAAWRHVEPATYRAAVLGFVPRGDDVKRQIAARLRLLGVVFATDDEADAWCIARHGLTLLRVHDGGLPPVVTQAAKRREKKKTIAKLLERKV